MWKTINSYEIITDINPGSIITNNPTDADAIYEIKKIHQGYIEAIHADDKIVIKVFPEKELISENWWVKK